MGIHVNLQELMKQKKITGLQLSKITGITPEHISVLKTGKTSKIKFETIEKLLEAFDIEPNDLFIRIKNESRGKMQ